MPNFYYSTKIEDINEKTRTAVDRITTDCVDRYKEVVVPKGIDFSHYEQNPVVMWGHDYYNPPIGRSMWRKVEGREVISKTEFAPWDDDSEHAKMTQRIFLLRAGGFLNATSIGFIPKDVKAPTEEDIKANNHWAGARAIFWKAELLEYSYCGIPANPEALRVDALKKGYERELGPLGIVLPPLEGEGLSDEVAMKPYPSEHACRLRQPEDFEEGSFRRVKREHEGKEYSVIMGKIKGETSMTEQAYRYSKDSWTVEAARSHCKAHKGISFEPAEASKGLLIRRVAIRSLDAVELASLENDRLARAKGRVVRRG